MKNILNKIAKFIKQLKNSKVLTIEQTKEKILAIRMTMIHCAIQSVAVSILALLLFIGAPSVFPEIINPYLPSSLKIMQAIVAVPAILWILAILVNAFSYIRIYKLQKSLSSKK